MLSHRTKVKRFRREREAEQAMQWLERVASDGSDAVNAPYHGAHLPPRRSEFNVRPGSPFARPCPAGAPKPRRPRVITSGSDADAPTQQLPVVRSGLAPVPVAKVPALPALPALPTVRAPQPAALDPRPIHTAQAMPGSTYTLTIPAAPTYAERLAAVFQTTTERLTALSGWAYNRTLDDLEVTRSRFTLLRARHSEFLDAPRELVAAR